jgi:VWFA-related protein
MRPATDIFFFDNGHLTLGGRQRSIDTARELIPKLVVSGAQATLVSNAASLETVVPLTTDAQALLQGLARMENDRTLRFWEPYSALEENRVEEVAAAAKEDPEGAVGLARSYQLEERWRQERDLRRLTMILGRFAEMDPPKAVLYFADTMRANAGEHYFSFFSDAVRDRYGRGADNESLTGALSFDRVIDEASAFGIRFYAVEGQGLTAPSLMAGMRNTTRTSSRPVNSSRLRDAQNTLAGLALETGGRAFVNAVPATKIAERVLSDLSCLYLVSFDPRGLREDAPLRVTVTVANRKVKVQTRGRLVVQSENARLTSRLLATFAAPDIQKGDVPMRVGIIPAGFAKGRYKARVQLAIPGTPVVGATWDLGVSLVSRGEVREDASAQIRTAAPNTPAVFEAEMTFGPGPYELVAVARDATADQTANLRLEGDFPDPDAALAMVGPIAVVQRVNGAFVRGGTAKTSGNLASGESDPLRTDVPTAVVSLVCRAKDQKGALTVERSLVGDTTVDFPSQTLDLGEERCGQILDVIPEGTLGEGKFRFVVRVLGKDGEIAKSERAFVAAGILPAS